MTMTKEGGIRQIARTLLQRYDEQGLRIPELRAVSDGKAHGQGRRERFRRRVGRRVTNNRGGG